MFLALAAGNILTPLLPLIQGEFAIGPATAGLLVSAFGFARLSLDLPAGFLQERLGPRFLASAGFILLVAASLLSAFAPRFDALVAGRIGMGLGSAILSVVVLTALSDLAPQGARAKVLALYTMANNAAIGLFPVVGGLMGALWGWRSTMILCAVLAVLSAGLLTRALRRVVALPSRSGAGESGRRPTLGRSALLVMAAVYFGVVINMVNRHGFRNTTLPLFANDLLGLNPLAIASGIALMAVVGLVIAIPGGMLADRWSRRGVMVVGFVVLALGDLAFLGASTYPLFLLASFALGLGDFFSASQTAALTEVAPTNARGRVLGGYRFAVDLGAAIGPLVLGGMIQLVGYRAAIVAAAGLLLTAAGVVFISGAAWRGIGTGSSEESVSMRRRGA
jgi:MFS family permease